MSNSVDILFSFHSDIFDKDMTEVVSAVCVNEANGHYKIESIPFHIPYIASQDIIKAEYADSEQILTYQSTVEYSGRTVIQVVVIDDGTEVSTLTNRFIELGCEIGQSNQFYYAMEIPFEVDYSAVKFLLDTLELTEVISYAEPIISDKHRLEGYGEEE